MPQHISNYLFYIIPIAAGIAFLVSLTIFFRPAKERYLKWFSIFLLVNCLMEMLLGFLAMAAINNILVINLWTMLVIAFDLCLVLWIVRRKAAKTVLLAVVAGYCLFTLINIFFLQRGAFHTTSYALGCLLIVVASIYYFVELFQQTSSVQLVNQPAFWIITGLLFYYCCTFPIYGLTKPMETLPILIIGNLVAILDLLNIFLYLSFTIAFLCRLRPRTSMQSF